MDILPRRSNLLHLQLPSSLLRPLHSRKHNQHRKHHLSSLPQYMLLQSYSIKHQHQQLNNLLLRLNISLSHLHLRSRSNTSRSNMELHRHHLLPFNHLNHPSSQSSSKLRSLPNRYLSRNHPNSPLRCHLKLSHTSRRPSRQFHGNLRNLNCHNSNLSSSSISSNLFSNSLSSSSISSNLNSSNLNSSNLYSSSLSSSNISNNLSSNSMHSHNKLNTRMPLANHTSNTQQVPLWLLMQLVIVDLVRPTHHTKGHLSRTRPRNLSNQLHSLYNKPHNPCNNPNSLCNQPNSPLMVAYPKDAHPTRHRSRKLCRTLRAETPFTKTTQVRFLAMTRSVNPSSSRSRLMMTRRLIRRQPRLVQP